jgi:hypothetical protein
MKECNEWLYAHPCSLNSGKHFFCSSMFSINKCVTSYICGTRECAATPTSLTLFLESSYFSCLSCKTNLCYEVKSWVCGLQVPKGCQPLVMIQKEELKIILSCLQCLLLDHYGINEYFQCQLESFLLIWCYVPFNELCIWIVYYEHRKSDYCYCVYNIYSLIL